ncbi:MAG: YdiU family protein [Gammaproteobacteria bacterium]|nr:YdiU family protein [Gammaproteobacteria bacterium]
MSWERLQYEARYSRLPEHFYSRVQPEQLPEPYLVHLNPDAADLIGLAHQEMTDSSLLDVLSGNRVHPQHEPLAMLYAGHQFGNWVPQLGDGRAIQLAEVVGKDQERWALQLKGSGLTPYFRGGDGRAVLRSSLREYLGSEAMHKLGVPTTRALSIIGSDLEVYREQIESAAVLLRMSPSFVRFGHFEVFASRGQSSDIKLLADHIIEHHYPDLVQREDKYRAFFRRVMIRTAELMAKWQSVGFMHGVMNTDNMSILGLTIDYGPFGFMEAYQPDHVCNHSDHHARYAYDRQPEIGLWNLYTLANALVSLIDNDTLKSILDEYGHYYAVHYTELMRHKLGLFGNPREEDAILINELLALMQQSGADFTNTFRALCEMSMDFDGHDKLRDEFIDQKAIDEWLERYRMRLEHETGNNFERRSQMRRVNPKFILRNYQAHIAIEKAQRKDFSEVDRLFKLLQKPFDENAEMERYTRPAPQWAQKLEISCSS